MRVGLKPRRTAARPSAMVSDWSAAAIHPQWTHLEAQIKKSRTGSRNSTQKRGDIL